MRNMLGFCGKDHICSLCETPERGAGSGLDSVQRFKSLFYANLEFYVRAMTGKTCKPLINIHDGA